MTVRERATDERGAALVEFALVLPLLLILLLGMLEFGKVFNYWIDTTHLANEGARWAVVNRNPGAGTLQEYIKGQANTIELRDGGTPSIPAGDAAEVCISFPLGSSNVGDPVQVTVSATYHWLLFVSFVVDVGNWFEHKRHLQLQADAGALAGGGSFYLPCADDAVETEARKYAGDPAQAVRYNQQVPHTVDANIHILINSTDFWNDGGVDYSDGGPPCAAKMVDVKITESNLPFFFGLGANFVPAINAHARVEIQALNTAAGALPVGVPDVNPTTARAWFINESTGEVLASTPLTNSAPAGGLSIWDNSAAPVSVPVTGAHIGVRVAFSGSTSTACGDLLVECYDLGSANGILYARGWSSAGSGAQPNPPLARSVTLFPGTCTDPYFSAASSSCTIGVRAAVDFGGDPALVGAKVEATVNGATNPLTYDAATGLWESTGANFFTINPGAGPASVTLKWEETIGTVNGETCKTSGGNKCTGSFGAVQRAFSATEARSGPIKLAQIWESGSFWANSFEQGTTHDLVVKVGIIGNLANAQSVSDPVVALRVIGGSQNQSLDCDPDLSKLKDELAVGCTPQYT